MIRVFSLPNSVRRIARRAFSLLPVPSRLIWAHLARANCKQVLLQTPHGPFWTHPADAVIGYSLFAKGNFDHADFARLTQAITDRIIQLPDDAVFIDAGANIGTHTIYALNSGLFSRAVCFEPDTSNFRFLQMNVAENGYADRCDLLNVALGERSGEAVLELSQVNPGDHRIRIDGRPAAGDQYGEAARQTIRVKMRTLDEALSDLGIDPASCFLHLDVQGFEPHVLQGAGRFLASCPAIFTEFWPYGMKRAGGYQRFRELASSQFECFIDIGADSAHRHPIDTLDRLFAKHQKGFGTTILLLKASNAERAA